MKKPWMKFYPADWRSDEALRSCSIAARGLWVEMMALMHVAEPSGSLLVKGKRPDRKQLASLAGISEKECTSLLLELEGMAVFSRDENGTIYSRRMRRDAERAEEDKSNGKKGGNPKLKDGVNPPDKAQMPETRIDVAVDAGARGGSLVTPEAITLTEKLLVIAGHDPAFWPPGWCGAPMRVQTWTDQGWKPDIIVAAVTSVAARKHGAPANSINFFERAIAEEHARQAAPVPKVEVREQQTITVNHGKPSTGVIQAADSLLARTIASFDGPGRGTRELRGPAGSPAPRLLSDG